MNIMINFILTQVNLISSSKNYKLTKKRKLNSVSRKTFVHFKKIMKMITLENEVKSNKPYYILRTSGKA
jgi:hypothetical protein